MRKSLADNGAGERGGSFRRIGVQRRNEQWIPQVSGDLACPQERPQDLVGPREKQSYQSEIIAAGRVGNAAVGRENPPRQFSGVGPQFPALAPRQIAEIENGFVRPRQPALSTDFFRISQSGMVARQQQVVTIVDRYIEAGVEVGAAAPARLRRGLVQRDLMGARELHPRRQAGEPGADDVNPRHQNNP